MPPSVQDLSDEVLAGKVRDDAALGAFEELVRRYEQRLYRFLCFKVASPQDAEDLCQQVFVTVFQKINQYKDPHPFGAWLFTIARRKVIDAHRRKRPLPEMALEEPVDSCSPADQFLAAEDRENLWQVVREKLPSEQATALWLMYAEDLSVGEISKTLRKTETHCRVLLHRGRKYLAGLLDRETLNASPFDRALRPREVLKS